MFALHNLTGVHPNRCSPIYFLLLMPAIIRGTWRFKVSSFVLKRNWLLSNFSALRNPWLLESSKLIMICQSFQNVEVHLHFAFNPTSELIHFLHLVCIFWILDSQNMLSKNNKNQPRLTLIKPSKLYSYWCSMWILSLSLSLSLCSFTNSGRPDSHLCFCLSRIMGLEGILEAN